MKEMDPNKSKPYSDLIARLIAHSVSVVLLTLLVLFSVLCPFRPLFGILTSIIAVMALSEFYRLAKKKGIHCASFLAGIFSFIFLFATLLKLHPEIVLGVTILALFIYYATKKESILGLSATTFGILYVIVPFACIIRIATQFSGPVNGFWLCFLILVTKSADMGGYFIGRTFGRHKLAQKLSPNKTIEGAFGGIGAAVLMAMLLVFIDKQYLHVVSNFSYLMAALLASVLAIFAMMGDLAESLLKRDADVKDSNTIPGIGGILDVVDALLFTAPVLYLFLKFYYPN